MSKQGMNKQGFLMVGGGLATAAAAHAAFFIALVAGQPAPAQYLAQLAAPSRQIMESPQWQLAARGAQHAHAPAARAITVAQPPSPEHLHKGLTTC